MKEIKRQIEYWEAVKKDNDKRMKTLQEQNKGISQTIKFLKSLLGVAQDESLQDEQNTADGFTSEESH